jgi:nanoRNase/pAp phosphatase (c-di-AMP/oligoRNAs hydrolase)
MHLIVTHTNADFDAVASLLGAWYLYPEAKPLLPPTLNRNVRDFVTLYENMFPFLHKNELGRDPITRLTLVDTQQIPPNLKYLAPNLSLHIIDHHDIQHPLPTGAVLSLTDTGPPLPCWWSSCKPCLAASPPSRPPCCCWVFTRTPAR